MKIHAIKHQGSKLSTHLMPVVSPKAITNYYSLLFNLVNTRHSHTNRIMHERISCMTNSVDLDGLALKKLAHFQNCVHVQMTAFYIFAINVYKIYLMFKKI